jgi:hypothetical protein
MPRKTNSVPPTACIVILETPTSALLAAIIISYHTDRPICEPSTIA